MQWLCTSNCLLILRVAYAVSRVQVGQGAGYVYMHQGCCEHLIELADVCCAHDANPADTRQYPCIIKQVQPATDLCIVLSEP